MASSSGSGVTRKLIWLGLAIVVAIALYTGGWFYAAGQVTERVNARLAASAEETRSATCSHLSVRGYPFRIGVFCDTIGIDDRLTGLTANFGALRSAAQVYWPGHAVLELDGPAQIRVTPDLVFDVNWDLLHASINGWTDGLNRASIAYDGLKGRLNVPSEGISLGIAARHGEKHIRQNGEALDVAASFDQLVLDSGMALPPVDAAVDMTIADAASWISTAGPPADAPLGAKIEVRRLSLDLGEGRVLALSGPLKVNDDGTLSGNVELDVTGINVWRDQIVTAFPEARETVTQIATVVQGLSKDGNRAVVKLKVRDGAVFLGFIPIFFIPPLVD